MVSSSPSPASRIQNTAVKLSEVFSNDLRLEAANYSIMARRAVEAMRAAQQELVPLYGESGISHEAHNAFRFRRIWVAPSRGVPLLSSSEIISLQPRDENYISRKSTPKLDKLLLRKWDVLISCSGTVGNVALAGDTFAGKALSQHAIRLRTDDPLVAGYVTAFLRSSLGRPQLEQGSYGSVVVHIEPVHLARVLLPKPTNEILETVGLPMCRAAEARDRANQLLNQASTLLHNVLNLPRLMDTAEIAGPLVETVRASQLNWRFEAAYHSPLAHEVEVNLKKTGVPIRKVGDPSITKNIRAVTKFRKRIYVREGGIPLLTSRQVFQVDPIDLKSIAKAAHAKDMQEIRMRENEVLVTCSGTIGRVMTVPKYMAAWAASQDVLRIDASTPEKAGFLTIWLSSQYGYRLLKRLTYGSVVVHIDREMLADVPIPLPDNEAVRAIGSLALEANRLRDEAWQLEQRAIAQVLLFASNP